MDEYSIRARMRIICLQVMQASDKNLKAIVQFSKHLKIIINQQVQATLDTRSD